MVNTQGQPCARCIFRICWWRRKRMKMLRDRCSGSLLCLWHCFSGCLTATAVCCLVPTTATTRLSAGKLAALALAHFWLVGISSLFAVILVLVPELLLLARGARNFAHCGNYCRRWADFSARCGAGDCVPVIGFGLQPAIIALILYGVCPSCRRHLPGWERLMSA